MPRSYELPCPVARSLDVIGDRWTLLIVRELLMGRARYSELSHALGTIPPNLLADRLRQLEDEHIVERLEGRRGYRLTPKGRELAPVLSALAVWGMRHYDEAPSALALHNDCGGAVNSHWVCKRCGETVTPSELELVDPDLARLVGPGAEPNVREGSTP